MSRTPMHPTGAALAREPVVTHPQFRNLAFAWYPARIRP